MKVKFYILENEAGGQAVLPTQRAVQDVYRKAMSEADIETDEAKAQALRARAAESLALWTELTKAAISIEFDIKPFTWGQKRDARKKATQWQGDRPFFDEAIYYTEVVKASTGFTDEQLDELSPLLGATLLDEVLELSEPNPEKLRFLSSSQPGSATTRN